MGCAGSRARSSCGGQSLASVCELEGCAVPTKARQPVDNCRLPLVTWSAAIAAAVMAPEVGLLGRLVLAAVALVAGGLYPPTKLLPRWAGRQV